MARTHEEYMRKEKELIGASTVEYGGPVISHGEGLFFRSLDSRMFLDFTGQVSLVNTGYCPAEVVSAIRQMAGKLHACMAGDWPYCVEIKISGKVKEISRVALAERLVELTDKAMPFRKRVYFDCKGADAVNLAVKIAKICFQRKKEGIKTEFFRPIFENDIFIPSQENLYRFSLLAFHNAFHGRHGEAHALSDSKMVHSWGISSSSTVLRMDFPILGGKDGQAAGAINDILDMYSPRHIPPIAAFVFEPVQGEGGINIPDGADLKEIVEYAKGKGFCAVADEIQTGFGRTGKMFSCEHWDIRPDMMTLSKSLGAGLAISAVVVNDEKFPNLEPGMHSGSHCADPLACAAAIANIDFILENGLVEQAANHGAYLLGRLKELASRHKEIIDVRGLGLMAGVEFENADQRTKIIRACVEEGLLLAAAGEKTIRMTPALIVTIPQIDMAINKFSSALEKVFIK